MANQSAIPREVERYFARDVILNIELSQSLLHGGGTLVAGSGDGALVRHGDDATFMLSAADRAYGDYLVSLLPKTAAIAHVCQEWLADTVMEIRGFAEKMACYKLAYLKDTPVAYEKRLDIRPATQEEAPRIAANYSIHDLSDIREAIEDGDIWTAYLGHEMAGFIGRHPEGSMGMLYVMESFRRQGYGYELEAFLLNRILARGEVPRGDVIVGNEASIALQEKLGFTRADSLVYWVY